MAAAAVVVAVLAVLLLLLAAPVAGRDVDFEDRNNVDFRDTTTTTLLDEDLDIEFEDSAGKVTFTALTAAKSISIELEKGSHASIYFPALTSIGSGGLSFDIEEGSTLAIFSAPLLTTVSGIVLIKCDGGKSIVALGWRHSPARLQLSSYAALSFTFVSSAATVADLASLATVTGEFKVDVASNCPLGPIMLPSAESLGVITATSVPIPLVLQLGNPFNSRLESVGTVQLEGKSVRAPNTASPC
jgi:hypothetical protein